MYSDNDKTQGYVRIEILKQPVLEWGLLNEDLILPFHSPVVNTTNKESQDQFSFESGVLESGVDAVVDRVVGLVRSLACLGTMLSMVHTKQEGNARERLRQIKRMMERYASIEIK